VGHRHDRLFNDLNLRLTELVARGFNCLRIEGGGGITHDADSRLRGEERSDAYWEVIEHAARQWHEYPECLQRVNAVFAGRDD
jgi:hypothetical protein